METKMGMNNFLFIAMNIGLLIILASYLIWYFKTRSVGIPSKQKFSVNPDQHYLNAVKLALSYGQLSSGFLRNRLKIDKATADELLARLYEKNVIVAPNEGGIARIVE